MPKTTPHQPTRDLVARNLKRLLREKKKNPTTLAAASGVRRDRIYEIEGAKVGAYIDTLGRLAIGLDCAVIEFFRE